MFAVIQTGGKQYRVAKDDIIKVEKLAGDAGETIEFGKVLMVGEDGKAPAVGTPFVDRTSVYATVLEQAKADKVLVFKKKRRHNYRRTRGHRQQVTVLRITDIGAAGKAAPKKAAPRTTEAKPVAETKAAPAKKPAAEKAAPAKKPAAEKAAPARKAEAKPAAEKKTAPKKVAPKKAAAPKKAPAKKPVAETKAPAEKKE